MTLVDLNASDQSGFVDALGWVFEHSPWVAERAWNRRPFASIDALHEAMTAVVLGATAAEQLTLLRAHPDLGSRATMSDSSSFEQSGAGVDRMGSADFARLRRLNAAYRDRFGFPFLFAVKGSTTDQILVALETRLAASRDAELAEGLRQVARIARFRLDATVHESKQGAEEG